MENNNAILIEAAENLAVSKFEQILFKEKYEVLIISGEPNKNELLQAWEKIYMEFIDISGIAENSELELTKSIFYLDSRVKKIELYLQMQRQSLNKIGAPCIIAFDKIKLYGHKLKWENNIDDFKIQLNAIEAKEKKYSIELKTKTKELIELRSKRQNGEVSVFTGRKEFIRTKNNLGKFGYKVDGDKTMTDEFALMIHDYNEANEIQTIK